MSKIKEKDVKALYAKAAGICSMTNCQRELIVGDIHIGNMAHIIAKKPAGPRGDEEVKPHINDYTNLILLCPTCHTLVDKAPHLYPAEELKRIKHEHETWVNNNLLNKNKETNNDEALIEILFTQYIDIEKLSACLKWFPITFAAEIYDIALNSEKFDHAYKEKHLLPFYDNELANNYNHLIAQLHVLAFEMYETYGTNDNGKPIRAYQPSFKNNASFLNKELSFQSRDEIKLKVRSQADLVEKHLAYFYRYLSERFPAILLKPQY